MKTCHIGYFIKHKREELGIAQDDLCDGICDKSTLSRIERGLTQPSYSLMSMLLGRLGMPEEPLLLPLSDRNYTIVQLQKEIVSCNASHNYLEALQKIDRLEAAIDSKDRIVRQFVLRARAIAGRIEDGQRVEYSCAEERALLTEAIGLTVPNFSLDSIERRLLGVEELKLINQLAITYSEDGQRRLAIDIYRQLLRNIQSRFVDVEARAMLLPLIAYNYSRLLGRERRYEECIEVAELGRKCCVEYNRCRMLGGLLHNQACALHELGQDERSKELLTTAYYVHKAMEREKSCLAVQEYAEDTFNLFLV